MVTANQQTHYDAPEWKAPRDMPTATEDLAEICRALASTHLAPELLSDAALDASLQAFLRSHRAREDLWLFAYGSLIWNPSFQFVERCVGQVHGYHRSFCLWSRINRGTPQRPGLVLALDRGGSCPGVAYRLAAQRIESDLHTLWRREMLLGSYRPEWVSFSDGARRVRALAFVVNRRCSGYAGRLPDERIITTLLGAHGRYGPAHEYLLNTVAGLQHHGIRDPRLARLREQMLAALAGAISPAATA